MRIGIIVDGQAEFHSLPKIYDRLDTNAVLLTPLRADIQPYSSPKRIVRAALTPMRYFSKKGVDRVVVCLDHENRSECIPEWCEAIENSLATPCANEGIEDVKVVIKARMYENWLISDPAALKKLRGRFGFSGKHGKHIAPNKADNLDATKLLKELVKGDSYNKVRDAVTIMEKFDPNSGAENSRSFRRLLRVLECEKYYEQSKVP